MAMSRKNIREQMQVQRPDRKRQLSEVSPSPPKKWMRFFPAADSPGSSPNKDPLVENGDDSPSFRAKPFYRRRKLAWGGYVPPQLSSSRESQSSTSNSQGSGLMDLLTSSDEKLKLRFAPSLPRSRIIAASFSSDEEEDPVPRSRLRTRSSGRVVTDNEQKLISPRVALSPIKNILGSIKVGTGKSKAKKTSKTAESKRKVRGQLKPRPRSLSPEVMESPKSSEKDSSVTSTPSSGRRFFKTKSPGEKSKGVGGILVGKGFNLKFVRGSVNKDAGKSSKRKKGTAPKKSGKKSVKTYSRKGGRVASVGESPALRVFGSHAGASVLDDKVLGSGATAEPVSSPQGNGMVVEEFGMFDTPSPFSSQSQGSPSEVTEATESSPHAEADAQEGKFYSIFSKKRCSRRLAANQQRKLTDSPKDSPKRTFVSLRGNKDQLVLDAGQKRFGAGQCKECGMVYTAADAADEATHAKFHQSALLAIKFSGWKKERVIQEYLDDGSRVLAVLPGDQAFMVKKVEEVNRVMGQELGFPDHAFSFHGSYKAFLYISDEKRIEGCCIAESITQGYCILPNGGMEVSETQRPWFCSTDAKPAMVGIGRLWVYGPSRKRGIATRLLECIRQWFEYGIVIDKSEVAFSDPTPDGRKFAAKYTQNPNFLVYKYSQ